MIDVLRGVNETFTNKDSRGNKINLVDDNVKSMLTTRVQNVHQLISNDLELVSTMAATGVGENISTCEHKRITGFASRIIPNIRVLEYL